ncbi:hypothetical protein ACOL3H_07195 [Aliarcobacter butzleri]
MKNSIIRLVHNKFILFIILLIVLVIGGLIIHYIEITQGSSIPNISFLYGCLMISMLLTFILKD